MISRGGAKEEATDEWDCTGGGPGGGYGCVGLWPCVEVY
uniref:Uncharacterized protein n=1 Tax=Rhizophora mucronata TaxID=61149 RepID=A0A2P2QAM8_RHIMU